MTERGLTSERPIVLSGLGSARRERAAVLFGGGPDGNQIMTIVNGAILIVLLAPLGLTILLIGRLFSEHLFVGLLLLGPLALKLATTGYRFARYCTGEPDYVRRGPPVMALRLLAPLVVLSTLVVFATGVVLLFTGPAAREPWLLLHKASFVMWLGVMAAHVLGHLPELLAMLRLPMPRVPLELSEPLGWPERDRGNSRTSMSNRQANTAPRAGAAGRAIALSGAIVGGVVLAVALMPQFGVWTSWMALRLAAH
jgi:hypothetical protein